MAQMTSAKPARKVWIGSLVGAASTVIFWLVEKLAHTTIPSPVAAAITTLLTGIVSYIVPPSADDQVVA